MSRAVVLAVGSRGDVDPCIALGVGLKRVGWDVRIAALSPFRDPIRARDLEFASLGALPQRFSGPSRWRPRFTGVTGRALFWAIYQRMLSGYLPAFTAACHGADLIVYTGLAFAGYHLAEAMQIPCASIAFVPGVATRAFANPLFASRTRSTIAAWNRATFTIEQELMMQTTAHHINRWRRRELDLPVVPRRRLVAHRWERTDAVILGLSEHVVPRPPDWGPRVHVTGYLVDDVDDSTVDPRLRAFVDAGEPPVYVGFGSMVGADGRRMAAAVSSALEAAGARGVLATGWGGLDMGPRPEHVHVAEVVPHQWLFPRVRAAVHHGGAGTTAAALAAGVPSIVVPFDYDQLYWGHLLSDRGLGPAPIPRDELTGARLATALRELDRTPYRERIRPIAAALRDEDGVGTAVAVIEQLVSESGSAQQRAFDP